MLVHMWSVVHFTFIPCHKVGNSIVPQQAALLSLQFVPLLAFVPVCGHISLLSYLCVPHAPAWVPACGLLMGGGGH